MEEEGSQPARYTNGIEGGIKEKKGKSGTQLTPQHLGGKAVGSGASVDV